MESINKLEFVNIAVIDFAEANELKNYFKITGIINVIKSKNSNVLVVGLFNDRDEQRIAEKLVSKTIQHPGTNELFHLVS